MKRRDRFVALALGALLFALPLAAQEAVPAPMRTSKAGTGSSSGTSCSASRSGVDLRSHDTGAAAAVRVDPASPLRVLGGRDTVAALAPRAGTRLRVEVRDADAEDEGMLLAAGTHAVIRIAPELLHVIVGAQAEKLAAAIGAPRV